MKKILIAGIILMLLIPTVLGTKIFNSRAEAQNYADSIINNFTVSMSFPATFTQDYDILIIENGKSNFYRKVCWKQNIIINKKIYSFDELRATSYLFNTNLTDEGFCILPKLLDIDENEPLDLLLAIQSTEKNPFISDNNLTIQIQTDWENIIRSTIIQFELGFFVEDYDADIRILRQNPIVGDVIE